MKKTIILSAILLFFFFSLSAEEQKYTDYSFARLSYTTGNSYLQKASDLSYEEAVVNMPITEGDRLGTTEGRVEIFLGKGNYIRLDYNTKIDFLRLPNKEDDLTQFQIWSGNTYFSINYLKREKNIEVHTPDTSFYILDSGTYRIDVRPGGETEIFVFSGLVEASGETGSVLVKTSQRLEAVEGNFTSRPSRFIAATNDSFDRWNENRESEIHRHLANRYLPEELNDFEYELSTYGDWKYVPPYGYVWVPGGVGSDWRPYYYGRWTWIPLAGWTWLPYEPWGWVAFHYGRWHWNLGLGWYWIPTTVWGPGWVSWYHGYDYFGWVPLSYYGYPGVIINNVYYDRHMGHYYPYNSRALTVIHKNQLKARNVSKVALDRDSIKNLGRITLSSKPPVTKPSGNKISIEKLDKNKVFLHKNSNVRFREGKRTKIKKEKDITFLSNKYRKSNTNTTQNITSSQERKIIRKKIGYPSSSEITIKRYPRKTSVHRNTSSFLGRFFNIITKKSSSSIKKSSSRSKTSSYTSSKKTSSTRQSSRRSSSRSSSGSSKTKKKK